jgi:hypothetical protein
MPKPGTFMLCPDFRDVCYYPSHDYATPNMKLHLTKVIMRIIHNGICILQGQRNPSSNLWKIDDGDTVATPPDIRHHQADAAIGSPTSAELVSYAHATLFAPALSTIKQALNMGWIHNFPGLTAKTLRRHPPRSIPMVKGHLDQS